MNNPDINICIVGLGYVGLPLAYMFATRYKVTGIDRDRERIEEINKGKDRTKELLPDQLMKVVGANLHCTTDMTAANGCDIFIIAVPTPVDDNKRPDLTPLLKASRNVASIIKPGAIVVYESTVAPGTTEDICAPILEKHSGLKYNSDFFIGYSPERINPGDKVHSVRNVRKIVSGSTPETATRLNEIYGSVLSAGTYLAPSIRVAEAAKIIENTQRDVNIAFINEITRILNAMNIDTDEVLKAASTKWNFMTFRPGLVGGHCIGVDPYYLITKAKELGVRPGLIAAARTANEGMAQYLVERTFIALDAHGISPTNANILMLGFSFKPDCPDFRNTKSYDVYKSLRDITPTVTIFDPIVDPVAVMREFDGLTILSDFESVRKRGPYDAIVRCTPHSEFDSLDINALSHSGTVDIRLIDPQLTVSSTTFAAV